jgi:hypothetical protein
VVGDEIHLDLYVKAGWPVVMRRFVQLPWSIATHANPAWRSKANFIIFATVDESHWEQLWTKRLVGNRFEICCIPFFVYDISLGDIVTVHAIGDKKYVIDQVLLPSSHYTFRVWFGNAGERAARAEVSDFLAQMGCLVEWWSHDLLAIDVLTDESAQRIADYLHRLDVMELLEYETGLSHDRPEMANDASARDD